MTDLEELYRRIKLGLVTFPLVAAPLLLSPQALAGPPGQRGGPYKCGSGLVSITVAEAHRLQKTTPRPAQLLVCPPAVAVNRSVKDLPKGLPGAFATLSLKLSVERTEAARKVKGAAADTCAYDWEKECPGRGRPLMSPSGPIVASLRAGDDWSAGGQDTASVDEATRSALAALWLEDALAEHASVASFSRASLELMAVGAPPELVAGCHRAALDEIRHAQICFDLAARYGAQRAPGPIAAAPLREATVVQVALDTLVEGCVGETIAALLVRRSAAASVDPHVKAALEGISDDEADHAALAWSTLSWALSHDGVGAAVLERLDSLRNARLSVSAPVAAGPDLSAHGRLSALEEHHAIDDAWRGLIEPAIASLTAESTVT